MHRRAYLTGFSTGFIALAGCVGNRDERAGVSNTGSSDDTPTPPNELETSNPQIDPETPTTRERRTQHLTTLKPSHPLADNVAVEHAVHRRVNDVRYERDIDTLRFDEDHQNIARTHSSDMALKGYFAHRSPEGRQFKPNDCSTWGENIFRMRGSGVRDPATVANEAVDSWLGSVDHRANLLGTRFGNEGIGVQWDSDGWVYVTQTLC